MRNQNPPSMRILSLSAEAPRAGSAAQTHLNGIRDALEQEGHFVETLWKADSRRGKLLGLLMFQLTGYRRILRADVVYARWHLLDVAHVMAARVLRKRVVLEVNGTSDDIILENPGLRRVSRLVHWLATSTLRSADHVIVVSPGLAEWVKARASMPVTFLPNGADAKIGEVVHEPATYAYAIFVGELARHQGIPTLLEARRSPVWPADLPLVIVGGGALQSDVESVADGETIVFRGRLQQGAAHALLAGASVSISPQTGLIDRNRLGVTPLKVAESMMLGTPVVGSRLPGITAMIDQSGAGGTFEPDNAEDLARVVAFVLAAETDRALLKRHAMKALSWQAIGSRTAKICAGSEND